MFINITHNVDTKYLLYLSGCGILKLNPSNTNFTLLALGTYQTPNISITYDSSSGIYLVEKEKDSITHNILKKNNSIAISIGDLFQNLELEQFITTQNIFDTEELNEPCIYFYFYDIVKKKWEYKKISSPYSTPNSSITFLPFGFLVGNSENPPFLLKKHSNNVKLILNQTDIIIPPNSTFKTRSIINMKGLIRGIDGFVLNGDNSTFFQKYPQYSFSIHKVKETIVLEPWIDPMKMNVTSIAFVNINPKKQIYGFILGTWGDDHPIYLFHKNTFLNKITLPGSYCNCITVADFDNDGKDEIFVLNYRDFNQLYKVEDEYNIHPIEIGQAYNGSYFKTSFHQTYISSVIGDFDNDGFLEIFNSAGDLFFTGNGLFKVYEMYKHNKNYIRIFPKNKNETPHRGAIVKIKFAKNIYKRIIDTGGNAYGQSEPIAHFGLGDYNGVLDITVKWKDGTKKKIKNNPANQVLEIYKHE